MDFSDNLFLLVNIGIKENGSIILENNDDYAVVRDSQAHIIYLLINKDNVMLLFLFNKYKDLESTVCIMSKYNYYLGSHHEFSIHLSCNQYRYVGEPFELNKEYQIEEVTMDDFPYLYEKYYPIIREEGYIESAISRGMLKCVIDNKIVGFIGEHPEHSIGLLFVDESYRRIGIARELEKAMINKMIKEGKTPIDHVEKDNVKSQLLQNSLPNMVIDEGYIDWYFAKL